MSAETCTFTRLHCDGCGATMEGGSAAEVRRDASSQGWVFPNKRKMNGDPAKRTHDVCPGCATSFEPALSSAGTEWAEMSAEERRLTAFIRTGWSMISEDERERLDAELRKLRDKRLKSPTSR